MNTQKTAEHVTADAIVDYFEHRLPERERTEIEGHVADCEVCAALARRIRNLTKASGQSTAKMPAQAVKDKPALAEVAPVAEASVSASSLAADTPDLAVRALAGTAEGRWNAPVEAEEEGTDETTVCEPARTSFWPRTVWQEVHQAAREGGRSPEELNQLILKYQRPLRAYLLAQFRDFPEIKTNADDLLQGFASQKILSQSWLGKANPQKGRFRHYLKRSLKNYVIDWGKKARLRSIPLDALAEAGKELAGPEPAQESFDFTFAQDVLTEALGRLEQDCKDPKRSQPRSSQIWELFRLRLLDPIFRGTQSEPYERLRQRFGLRSPTEGTNMLLAAKRMFKRHLQDVIADYEGSDEAAKTELARLTEFVSGLAKRT